MPKQPMILKMKFYLPGATGKDSLAQAARHADYIVKEEKNEVMMPSRETLESAAIHAKYAGERPGNMGGLFGPDPHHPPDVDEVQRIMRMSKGPVWLAIVTVGEADALSMGGRLTTQEGWAAAARKVMPDIAKHMGIDPANLDWSAAAHRWQHGGERNPHIHLQFWEKHPTRVVAQLTTKERKAVRQTWVKTLYAPEFARLGQEKSQARQTIRAEAQALLDQARFAAKGQGLESGTQRELIERLQVLGDQLPSHGRLAYAYMPPEIKQAVMDTAHWLMDSHPRLKAAREQAVQASQEFAKAYQAEPGTSQEPKAKDEQRRQETMKAAADNATQDLAERLVGPILKAAASIHRTEAAQRAHEAHRQSQAISALGQTITREIHRAEAEGVKAAVTDALAKARRKQAELAMAQNTGTEIIL